MASLRSRVVAAYRAFREPMLVTAPLDTAEFDDFNARRLRYAIYWAFFENDVYRAIQKWSHTYKIQHGLYRYVRNIYNPAHRLGTFWQTHLMGGLLDPMAGDGTAEPSALPIQTEHDALRGALAQLWRDSNWNSRKDVWTLQGTVFGDCALEVVDDAEREKVYLKVVNPSIIKQVALDPFGNVKGYVFEQERDHPERAGRSVTYREEASRDGDAVMYRTFLNDAPYAWPGQDAAEWEEPYGFIPLVVVQHNDVGLTWGWSEMHPGRGKFHEVDDLASKLSDQVRKSVDAAWLFSGVQKPSSTPTAQSRDSETYQESSAAVDRPYPGREEMTALYGPADAKAHALVAPLDIAGTTEYIRDLLKELERDYPELQMDIWTASGDASGRALRVARQRAEAKVHARRVAYDDALERAQAMAVAIGGHGGYEGYAGFGLDSYERGDLEHHIGKRPVFAVDPLDDIEIDAEFWKAAVEAAKVVPIRLYLKRQGWSDEELTELDELEEAQAWRGVERGADWNAPESEPEAEGD